MSDESSPVWYRDQETLGLGGCCRYYFLYKNTNPQRHHVSLRIKNMENITLRTFNILSGPLSFYCHVVPNNYSSEKIFEPENPEENTEVVFKNEIKAGQSFNVTLLLNKNSYLEESDDGYPIYSWNVDIISQIVLSRRFKVSYMILVGDNMEVLKKFTHQNHFGNTKSYKKNSRSETHEIFKNEVFKVKKKTTSEIWSTLPQQPEQPAHLVVLTHGLFSNLTADMLYIKDSLEQKAKDNLIVCGYEGNAGQTEKGVEKLGIRVAKYVKDVIKNSIDGGTKIDKISFIGHSLGGLIQTYALKYLISTEGIDYFTSRQIRPVNFLCLASPLLGILSEMSILITWVFDLGTLGKTGRDLTLLKRLPSIKYLCNNQYKARDVFRPVLKSLPSEPLPSILGQFDNLAVYANAVNDGIVPLRTASLLYLDYEALLKTESFSPKSNEHTTSEDHKSLSSNLNEQLKHKIVQIPKSLDKEEIDKARLVLEHYWKDKNFKRGRVRKWKRLSKRKYRTMMKINAQGLNTTDNNENESIESRLLENSSRSLYRPPKTSAVESALNVLISPQPSYSFIFNPETRESVIFHDKYYPSKGLPINDKVEKSKKGCLHINKTMFDYSEWKLQAQVKIAKQYHSLNLNWRKVLVNLPPDAHNNITVRRRFANGFGWGVVDHLCSVFF